ncbi:MAG TPA: hypothetical protein VGH72_28115 [Pseudonocardia sp.]
MVGVGDVDDVECCVVGAVGFSSTSTLAAEALRLDLVDVVELLWCPTILGGG